MADRTLRIKLTANTDSYRAEMDRASRLGTNYYQTMGNGSKRLDSYLANNNRSLEKINSQMVSATNLAKGFLAVFAGGFAVSNLVNISDSWGQMAARIRLALNSVEGSADSYASVQERLLDISNRNARAIEQSQELYIQSADSMKGLGYSTGQTLDFIETLSNEFTINATSAEKTKSSIDALSKAMATGKLDSNSFKTVLSAMPSAANELAIYLKKDINEVKALGLAGKISMRDFANAMIEAKGKTTDLANSIENSIADGVTKVSNSFKSLLGEANQTYGVTYKVSEGLDLLAKNMDVVAKAGTVIVGIGLARYFGNLSTSIYQSTAATIAKTQETRGLALAQKQAVTANLQQIAVEEKALLLKKQNILLAQTYSQSLKAQMSLSKQLAVVEAELTGVRAKQTTATAALTKANQSLSLVSRAGSGLLGIMGGPVGLIATVGILAASFWDFGDSADKAKKPIEELQLPIDQLITKLRELDTARRDTIKTGLEDSVTETAKKIKSNLTDIREAIKDELSTSDISPMGPTGNFISPKNNQAIDDYISQALALSKAVEDGKLSSQEFDEALAAASGQFIKSTNGGEGLRKVISRINGELLKNIDVLDETNKKLNATNGIINDSQNGLSKGSGLPPDTSLYDNALKRINDQINATKLLTEAARMRYETEHGALKALDEPERKKLINAAAQLDLTKKLIEEENKKKKLYEDGYKSAMQTSLKLLSPMQSVDYDEKSETDKLDSWYELALEINAGNQEKLLEQQQVYEDAKTAIQKDAAEKRQKIIDDESQKHYAATSAILSSSSDLFGGLADITKTFSNEQSTAYKAMFAISKGFAVANAALSLQVAISEAMKLSWPANIPAIAQAVSLGGQVASNIASLNYGGGREHGGKALKGSFYETGEKGKPELFFQDGKQYLIPGNNGTVLSNRDLKSLDSNIINNINFDSKQTNIDPNWTVNIYGADNPNANVNANKDKRELNVYLNATANNIREKGVVYNALKETTNVKSKL